MLISTLNCEMWPNFSYRGVRSVQLLLLLLLLMVFSSENVGFSPPYAGIAGIGPGVSASSNLATVTFLAFFKMSQHRVNAVSENRAFLNTRCFCTQPVHPVAKKHYAKQLQANIG